MEKEQIREIIAKRVAMELKDGDVVNLGIGLPTAVPDYLPEGVQIFLQSENGLLGMGPTPAPGEEDPEFINAGGGFVTASRRLVLRQRHLVRHHPRRSCERFGAGSLAGR